MALFPDFPEITWVSVAEFPLWVSEGDAVGGAPPQLQCYYADSRLSRFASGAVNGWNLIAGLFFAKIFLNLTKFCVTASKSAFRGENALVL